MATYLIEYPQRVGCMAKLRDLKEACVLEALAIVASDGVEKLSLREVARRLGVSHQAPYRHFASRDHLLAEIVSRAFRSFADVLTEATRDDDPQIALAEMGIAYLDYARREPLAYRLMFGTLLPDVQTHPAMMAEARHAFDLLLNALAKRKKARAMPTDVFARGSDEDLAMMRDAIFIWSTLHGFASIQASSAVETLGLPANLMDNMFEELLTRIRGGFEAT